MNLCECCGNMVMEGRTYCNSICAVNDYEEARRMSFVSGYVKNEIASWYFG